MDVRDQTKVFWNAEIFFSLAFCSYRLTRSKPTPANPLAFQRLYKIPLARPIYKPALINDKSSKQQPNRPRNTGPSGPQRPAVGHASLYAPQSPSMKPGLWGLWALGVFHLFNDFFWKSARSIFFLKDSRKTCVAMEFLAFFSFRIQLVRKYLHTTYIYIICLRLSPAHFELSGPTSAPHRLDQDRCSWPKIGEAPPEGIWCVAWRGSGSRWSLNEDTHNRVSNVPRKPQAIYRTWQVILWPRLPKKQHNGNTIIAPCFCSKTTNKNGKIKEQQRQQTQLLVPLQLQQKKNNNNY